MAAEILAGAALKGATGKLVEKTLSAIVSRLYQFYKDHPAQLDPRYIRKTEAYLDNTYKKLSTLNLIFPSKNKKLKSLYVPLTIVEAAPGEKQKIRIDDSCSSVLAGISRVLIVDNAGMGKSTLLKYIFLRTVEEGRAYPLFVELRRLSAKYTVLDYLADEFKTIRDDINKEFLQAMLRDGEFVFFLDGYDEITATERVAVTEELQRLLGRVTKTTFILSSRKDEALSSFGDFTQFEIRQLTQEEAEELVGRYDGYGETYKRLKKEFKTPAFHKLRSFLGNPLLVSLLYGSYLHTPTIPLKRVTFYDQVYDALFERHDLSKGGAFIREKKSKLDKLQFRNVVSCLAFYTLVEKATTEYQIDSLGEMLGKAKNRLGIEFSESLMISDLVSAVPLFTMEGPYYRWSHKSIQEYFSALFIHSGFGTDGPKMLSALWNSSREFSYANVLEFYYDIDSWSFDKILTVRLLETFLSYTDAAYSRFEGSGITEEDLNRRKSLTFGRGIVLAFGRIKDPVKTFNEILESAKVKLPDGFGLQVFALSGPKGSAHVVHTSSRFDNVISILHSNGQRLFQKRSRLPDISAALGQLEELKKNENVTITDDPEAWFNSPQFFRITSCALEQFNSLGPAMDISACRSRLETIRKRIHDEQREADSFLKSL